MRPGETIDREEHQRDELDVLCLQVSQADENVRIEGARGSANVPGCPTSRPAANQQTEGPTRQGKAGNQDEVVREDGRSAGGRHRHRQHALHDHRFREGERERLGIKDVGVEQVQRIARQLVHHPCDRPGIHQRVALIVSGQVRGVARARPGVNDRQHGEGCQRREDRMLRVEPNEPAACPLQPAWPLERLGARSIEGLKHDGAECRRRRRDSWRSASTGPDARAQRARGCAFLYTARSCAALTCV